MPSCAILEIERSSCAARVALWYRPAAVPWEGRAMAKKQPPTEAQKAAYLGEHMGYEIGMLHYAIESLVTCDDTGHALSMRYECFAVHARNLGNFLINKDDGSYQAHDFNNNFRPAKQTKKR